MITHIIFDNNGVLTTSDKERTYKIVSEFLGISVEKYIALLNKFVVDLDKGKMSQDEFYAGILREGGLKFSVAKLKKVHLSGYINKLEVQEFAKKMRKKFEVALLSNFGDAFWEMNKKAWKLNKIFSKDKMFVSSDIGMAKPEEDIYLYLLKKLKVKPENCVFIDDNADNIKTARRLKFNSVLFSDLGICKRELSNLGVSS